MQTAAAITMVRDDLFYLNAWLGHYGGLFGRENCYVINHGRGAEVSELAAGCNVIGIPGAPQKGFEVKRWALLNGLVSGLRRYVRHIIVGDVDELVVIDPQAGLTLTEWLDAAPTGRIYTPLGLELVHRTDIEHDPIDTHILGPRRHVRLALNYSKPCVISAPTKLSRGGHFAQLDTLYTPGDLYLLHLKFCDFATYTSTMDRRNAMTAELDGAIHDEPLSRQWYAQTRGDDLAVFEEFAARELRETFEFRRVRRRMKRSFAPRGTTGYFEFKRPEDRAQYLLPGRFSGLF